MSWTRAYGLSLRLLPAELRRKHGAAMQTLFARELDRARAHGRLHGALAGAAGVWDVVWRGAYEQIRPSRHAAPAPQPAGANPGGPPVPLPTTAQLLRRHARSFAIAFAALTACMLALFASRRMPAMLAQDVPTGTVAELLLLAVPFMAAMTIPMSVFVAVLHEFTRMGADGTLAAARRERHGVRRLVVPVLGAAAGVAALALVLTAQVVPHTNARLVAVQTGAAAAPSDRAMTIAELRAAARDARPGAAESAVARAARYEVEVQKKLALPVACVVLALAGMAIALRAPRGGAWLVIGASVTVFVAYYVVMITGESLADRLVVSPFVGMWGANLLLLALALLALWRRRSPLAPGARGTVAIG